MKEDQLQLSSYEENKTEQGLKEWARMRSGVRLGTPSHGPYIHSVSSELQGQIISCLPLKALDSSGKCRAREKESASGQEKLTARIPSFGGGWQG